MAKKLYGDSSTLDEAPDGSDSGAANFTYKYGPFLSKKYEFKGVRINTRPIPENITPEKRKQMQQANTARNSNLIDSLRRKFKGQTELPAMLDDNDPRAAAINKNKGQ